MLPSLISLGQTIPVDYLDHQIGDYIYLIESKNSIATVLNKTSHEIDVMSINQSTMSASLKTEALYNGMYFATISGQYSFKGKVFSRNFPIDIAKYRDQTPSELDYLETTESGDTIYSYPGYIARYLVLGVKWKIGDDQFETVLIKEMPSALAIGEENHFQRIVVEITDMDLGIAKKVEFKNLGNFSIQLKNEKFLVVLENQNGTWEKPVFEGSLPDDGVYEFETLIKLPDLGWKKVRGRENVKLSIVKGKLNVTEADILGGTIKTMADPNSSTSSKDQEKVFLGTFPGSQKHKDVWMYNGYGKDLIFFIPLNADKGNQAFVKSDEREMIRSIDNTGKPVKFKLTPGVYPIFYLDKDFLEEYVVFSNLTVGKESRQKASFMKSGIRKF